MTMGMSDLPTLEELKARGPAPRGRALTPEEWARAKANKAQKPKHLETKRKSEALCKRHFQKWGAKLSKARDDERHVKDDNEPDGYRQVRISTDVDFVGTIPLCVNGHVTTFPLKVESKGITLKRRVVRYLDTGKAVYKVTGSFPLKNLSAKERSYLRANRQAGGLSVVHMAMWLDGAPLCVAVIPWKDWGPLEAALAEKAKNDKRYRGKSLRYHADLDLILHCRVQKLSGRWELCDDHWLASLLPRKGEQPTLL
jgi:hypothetical protein